MITGILPVSSGKIVFEGQDITKEATVKRGISIKMQVPGLFGDLTLRENIRIAAQNFVKKSELNSEIDRLIELVHIQDLGNPCVKNMTHGQQ